MESLLSVVVPVYNTEKYLPQCLDSIVNQTYKNLEILLVYDHSEDRSKEICLDYALKDPRIIFIEQPVNKKLGGARNAGLRHASGNWVAFVDNDDYLAPDIFEKALKKLQKNPGAELLLFYTQAFGFLSSVIKPGVQDGEVLSEKNINKISYSAYAKIFRTKMLLDRNIFFPEDVFCEDLPFFFQLAAECSPHMVVEPAIGYYYRRHQESLTGNMPLNNRFYAYCALETVCRLQASGKWGTYKEAFFEHLTYLINYYPLLDSSVRPFYAESFILLHRLIKPTPEELKRFPELSISYIQSKNPLTFEEFDAVLEAVIGGGRRSMLELSRQLSEIRGDWWYQFGRLGRKKKCKAFIKKIWEKLKKETL